MAGAKGFRTTNAQIFFLLALSCLAVFCVGIIRSNTGRTEVEEGDELVEIASLERLPGRPLFTRVTSDCDGSSDRLSIRPPTENGTEIKVEPEKAPKWRKDWRGPGHATPRIPPNALRWSPAASEMIHGLLQAQQFPDSCAATKWLVVEMDQAGLMWNYHAFLRALIIGLQSGRTVIPIARSPGPENEWEVAAFLGCENLHLGCFFHITKCSLEDSHQRARLLSEMPFMSGYHWPYKNVTERERLSREEVLKLRAFKGWEYDWRYTFPAGLWELLSSRGMVYLEDRSASVERASSDQRHFMLFSIVSSWLFDPVQRVKDLTDRMMTKYEDWRPRVVALHIRRGDKMAEDPYWVAHKTYRPASDYGKRIQLMERKRGVQFSAVLLASDSATLIDTISNDPASAGLRSRIGVMYDWERTVSVLEEVDEHTHVPREKKRDLQDHLVATLYAMVQVSEYVVCNLSSNICRFLWTAMGAKKRLEQVAFQGELGSSLDPPEFYSQWEN